MSSPASPSGRQVGAAGKVAAAAAPATRPISHLRQSDSGSSEEQPVHKRRRLSPSLAPVNAESTSGTKSTTVISSLPPKVAPAPAAAAKKAPAAAAKKVAAAPVPNKDDDKEAIWMIVGLGNPGANYERTRHNVGFMVVDELARMEGIECKKLEKSAAVGRGEMCGRKVILAKPVTFMNNSGESVAALAKFYKIPNSRILVIADDLDLPSAALRLRAKGGHGGHNGLRSIIERLGNSQEFPRIKIGIGRPTNQALPIATWVLQDFSKKEAEEIGVAVRESTDIVRSILTLGMEKALSGVKV